MPRRRPAAGESGPPETGGRSVFVDVLVPPPQLVVLGAGDDARPLGRVAADGGFRGVVVGRRVGLLTRERFPAAAALVRSTGDELGEATPLDAECYAVVMNHNFADDQAYLRALLKTPVCYIGVLGPRQRTDRMLRNLAAQGPLDEGRVYGPVGLDIGTDGAEQVALAVIAEVVLLADMVHVTAAALAELVTRTRSSDAPLVVSRYGDVTAPPLLFRRALFGELLAWTGEGCGKVVVQAHK